MQNRTEAPCTVAKIDYFKIMKTNLLKSLIALITVAFAAAAANAGSHNIHSGGPKPITHADLMEAQQNWVGGLLAIAEAHRNGEDYRALAASIIDSAYNYANAPVLFKPTLTHGAQTFRPTREGALAYFVGGNPNYPDDAGFALKGWVSVETETAVAYIEGNLGITMGHFTFTNESGDRVTVEKTFVFRRGDDNNLRIVLHKSTIPFSPSGS